MVIAMKLQSTLSTVAFNALEKGRGYRCCYCTSRSWSAFLYRPKQQQQQQRHHNLLRLIATRNINSIVSQVRLQRKHQRFRSWFRNDLHFASFYFQNQEHGDVGESSSNQNGNHKNELLYISSSTETLTSDSIDDHNNYHLHQEWTLEHDKILWEYRHESLPTLACMLGRGLRGVKARLEKLQNVESPAYQRLFVQQVRQPSPLQYDFSGPTTAVASGGNLDSGELNYNNNNNNNKLAPVSEVLRRIQWDVSIPKEDFIILYKDRVNNTIVQVRLDAPNHSISGKSTRFVDALPEHRIMAVKYRERVVWDRRKRLSAKSSSTTTTEKQQPYLNLVLGSPGIAHVIATYDEWKEQQDEQDAWNRQRHANVLGSVQLVLGAERFQRLKELSIRLQTKCQDETVSQKLESESYVESARRLFRQARQEEQQQQQHNASPSPDGDGTNGMNQTTTRSLAIITDHDALDMLSEFVAVAFTSLSSKKDESNDLYEMLASSVLSEISLQMDLLDGKNNNVMKNKKTTIPLRSSLPELREEDLTETFVRGSGAGGQKINKTSNKVLLIHNPTRLRVECQETRSLQQNRKIARQRLRQKLDEFMNGSQSRSSQLVNQQVARKQKAKAKRKSRARKNQQERQQQETDQDNDNDDDDEDDKIGESEIGDVDDDEQMSHEK